MKPEKKRTRSAKSEPTYSITDMNGKKEWGHYSYLNANGETDSPRIFSFLDTNGRTERKSLLYSLLHMNGLLKGQRQ
ncbi:hypothetical protein VSQ32_14945 [Lachnospiraceae bacterium KK002]